MTATAARAGLLVCHSCAQLNRRAEEPVDLECARCGAALHWRKPDSLLLSWILLAMAGARTAARKKAPPGPEGNKRYTPKKPAPKPIPAPKPSWRERRAAKASDRSD